MAPSGQDVVDSSASRAPQVAVAVILSPAIATVFVLLRTYTRVFVARKYFVEDYCIALAMILSVLMSVCMGISTLNGFGRHIVTVTAQELSNQSKAAVATIQLYIYTHMLLKLSILLQYVRISVMALERHICYAIIALLVAESIAMSVANLCLCFPFRALWEANVPGARCLNRTAVYYAQLSASIAMDFTVLVAPLFILRHLTLRWPIKLLLSIVLAFGGMACIVSVLRIMTIYESTHSTDNTWDKVPSAIYGVIEPNLGLVCASAVTLRPLFRRYFKLPRQWYHHWSASGHMKIEAISPSESVVRAGTPAGGNPQDLSMTSSSMDTELGLRELSTKYSYADETNSVATAKRP